MESSSSTLAVRTAAELLYRGRKAELNKQYPRMLVLLAHHWIGMEEGFAAVRRLAGKKLRLQLWVDSTLGQTLSAGEIALRTGVDDFLRPGAESRAGNRKSGAGAALSLAEDIQYLFIPVLSFSLLSKISRLDDEQPLVRFVLQGLCSGKKVAALGMGIEGNNPAWDAGGYSMTPAMSHEAGQMLGSLRSYGITLLRSEGTDDWITDSRSKKQIITGDDIMMAHSRGLAELKLDRDAVITPLARDWAAQYGIMILQTQDGETI